MQSTFYMHSKQRLFEENNLGVGNVSNSNLGKIFLTFVGVSGLDAAKVSLFKH